MSFEKHIRRNLKHHRSKVDADALWANIEAELDEDDKHRGGAWFILPLLLGLVVLGGVLLGLHNTSDNSQLPLEAGLLLGMHTSEGHMLPETMKEGTVVSQNLQNTALAIHDEANDLPIQNGNSKPIISKKKYIKNIIIPIKQRPQSPSIYGEKLNSTTDNDKSFFIDKKDENEQDIIGNTNLLESLGKKPRTNLYSPELIPNIKALVTWDKDENISLEKEEKTSDKKQRANISLGMWFGYAQSSKYFKSKNIEDKHYVTYRADSEEYKSALEVGGDVIIRFRKGFGLRAGIAYTIIREDFLLPNFYYNTNNDSNNNNGNFQLDRFEHTSSPEESIPQTSAVTSIPQGSSFLNWENINNRYEIFDIPLLFNYELGRKRVKLNLESGIYLNLSMNAKGGMRSLHGKPFLISPRNYPYRKNMGVSPYAGISLGTQLNANTSIILKGHYRYSPLSMTKRDNKLKQRLGITGVNIGIRYAIDR